jgi:hypothetical protein
MTDIAALPPPDEGLSDEAIRTCIDSLGWSVWAFDLATEIVTFPVEDLAHEMATDPYYAVQIVEVYKMMAYERAESAIRERIADDILNRLRNALTQANLLPAGDPLTLTIDYNKVLPCVGFHPDDIHCLRPDLR